MGILKRTFKHRKSSKECVKNLGALSLLILHDMKKLPSRHLLLHIALCLTFPLALTAQEVYAAVNPSVVMVALLTNLLLGLAVSGVLYFGDEMILRAMGLNEVLLPYGTAYMRIVGAFAFFQALSMTLASRVGTGNIAALQKHGAGYLSGVVQKGHFL